MAGTLLGRRGRFAWLNKEDEYTMITFSTWFNGSWYGGLICCLLATTTNILYSALCQRGRTRQLARVTVVCVISTVLLAPAIIWFNNRFSTQQTLISVFEAISIMIYIAIFGWLIPLGVTSFYCLFTLAHFSNQPSTTTYRPPRYQPGVEVPFVFSTEIPWGWLEYSSGNFYGQRLALKRAIITIGRDEQCDIWLDDDMASRYHAELAWDNGNIYLTDCESLNGVLLNKHPVRGTASVKSNDLLQIGSHHFVFVLAEPKDVLTVQDDPLTRHTWRSTQDLQTGASQPVPLIEKSPTSLPNAPLLLVQEKSPPDTDKASPSHSEQIAQLDYAVSLPQLLSDPSEPVHSNYASSPPVATYTHNVSPPLPRAVGGPMPLKLPSKQKG